MSDRVPYYICVVWDQFSVFITGELGPFGVNVDFVCFISCGLFVCLRVSVLCDFVYLPFLIAACQ